MVHRFFVVGSSALFLLAHINTMTSTAVATNTTPPVVDLYLYERTFEKEGGRCRSGCHESSCYAVRDFRIGDTCIKSNDFTWSRWEHDAGSNKEEMCVLYFSDSDCTQQIDSTCYPLGADVCSEDWIQVHLFPDACIESSVPQDEYEIPFVFLSGSRTENDCLENIFTAETFLPASPKACFPTRVLSESEDLAGKNIQGSVSMECRRDGTNGTVYHETRYFSDERCSTQESVFPASALTYDRNSNDCTPALSGGAPWTMVECKTPVFHCKLVDAYKLCNSDDSSVRSARAYGSLTILLCIIISLTF